MNEIEVHISLRGRSRRVGTLFRHASRGRESVTFQYHEDWLEDPAQFSLEPALSAGEGVFHPGGGREMFGSIGDSAPDSWGRQLMRRAERQSAREQGRQPRTLHEVDFLLGVSDVLRVGALRFKLRGDSGFRSPAEEGVPGFVRLASLLASSQRVVQGESSHEDLHRLLAPGSSLGGARPKASVVDSEGALAIAKFPKLSDEYSLETWEHIALLIAREAGIRTPRHKLLQVDQRPVLISWRFDRQGEIRVPFLSAMSMLQAQDGERGSYPEIVDELARHGARAKSDAAELFRRMAFNILVSNVDDHLRNHGFLWSGGSGWVLSPAYDLNPTPTDLKTRILTTNISIDEGACSLELALDQCEMFGLSTTSAKAIVAQVSAAVAEWRVIAARVGETRARIERMASAFEHEDLERGLRIVNE